MKNKKIKIYYIIEIVNSKWCVYPSLDTNSVIDGIRSKLGNYFRTKRQAQKKLSQILKVLKIKE
jgi:hypothetical protein